MTIDKAIAHAREKAKEHEQLVAWLEELKAYRTLDKTNFSDGYNKAIDDFVNNCSEYYFTVDDSPFRPYLRNIKVISQPNIEKIAEQLKAGGNDE